MDDIRVFSADDSILRCTEEVQDSRSGDFVNRNNVFSDFAVMEE